ncbi:MAG: primase-helicase zinc-binding domain-containing protein, partial [Pirellulales bacterium]
MQLNAKSQSKPLRGASRNGRVDIQAVKQAAAERWPEILAAVVGVDPALLDGKHHPCPRCAGTDRFRMLDGQDGALFCNQCFSKKNGDGIAAVQWLGGCSFPKAARMVADYLGIKPTSGNSNGATHKKNGQQPKHKKKAGRTFGSPELALDELDKWMVVAGNGKRVAKWSYRDKTGNVETWVVRYDLPTPEGEKQKKTFRPISKHEGRWQAGDPPGQFLPIDECLRIADLLCSSLEYAHQYTVHRDVKPENIMIAPDGGL